jgi:hypothetical protein
MPCLIPYLLDLHIAHTHGTVGTALGSVLSRLAITQLLARYLLCTLPFPLFASLVVAGPPPPVYTSHSPWEATHLGSRVGNYTGPRGGERGM